MAWTLVIVAGVDLSVEGRDIVAGSLVTVPFLTSTVARPRLVAGLGALAMFVAVVLAEFDGLGVRASVACVAVLLGGTICGVRVASVRVRRDERLVAVTSVAEVAQRAILRSPPPLVGSVRVATWYQSSVCAATVGGDCYEVLATPYGTRAIIGDVRGHGMSSVRLAALILGGFRALARIEADLGSVARHLDMLAASYADETAAADVDGEEFVTAVLCEFEESSVTIANCGHPGPLLVSPDGRVGRLDASVPASPLGIGGNPILDRYQLAPGSRLLLYTDGLLEARDRRGGFFDFEGAASALAVGSPEVGVATVIARLNTHAEGHVDDDVALVLLEPQRTDRLTRYVPGERGDPLLWPVDGARGRVSDR